MNKTFMSLAALTMLMVAPVMTSCSKDMDNAASTEKNRKVTVEIAFPEQAETRTVIENNMVTAWKAGDKVTLYKVVWEKDEEEEEEDGDYSIEASAEFTFVSGSTFCGELPEEISSVNEFNYAVHQGEMECSSEILLFTPNKQVATNLADVLMMIGEKDNMGNFKMKIVGNYLKLVNNSDNITVALQINTTATYRYVVPFWTYSGMTKKWEADGMIFAAFHWASFTLEGGKTNYIFVGGDCGYGTGIGIINGSGNWILNPKTINFSNSMGGTIYNASSYPSN